MGVALGTASAVPHAPRHGAMGMPIRAVSLAIGPGPIRQAALLILEQP